MPQPPDNTPAEPAADEFDLIDLGDISLNDVLKMPPTALAASLRRILDEIDNGAEPVAGWQSAL